MSDTVVKAQCRCGGVTMEARGSPIVTAVCHCSSCTAAGRMLEKLPGAAPVLDDSEGVPYVLFRKDRVRCTSGQENLREHHLTENSPTRRVVAVCCNTFMFLDFTKGHWITLARDRLDDDPAIENAPVQTRASFMLVLRLASAWARMGFVTPKIGYVQGRLTDV